MATLKQRMWRKNNAGTYDTIHLETESSLVLRPSGRTVEQDLTDFLPEVQATDDVPETLKRRKLVIGETKAFLLDKALAFEGATTQVSWDNVTGKPDIYPPESHTHDMIQVTGLEDELSSMQSDIANKANSNHTHSISNITNLQSTLNGKANTEHTHEIADVTNLQTQLNGKAASSHNHSASNITSGTLPVTRGGTGVTTNPSILVDLGRTTAASVFASAPRPGVTGTLPVSRGGTGVTSLESLKSSINLSYENILAIATRATNTTKYDGDYPIPVKLTAVKSSANDYVTKTGDYYEFVITSWPSELSDRMVTRIDNPTLGGSSGYSGECAYTVTVTIDSKSYILQDDVGMTALFETLLGPKCGSVISKNNYSKWKFRVAIKRNSNPGHGGMNAKLNQTTTIYEYYVC